MNNVQGKFVISLDYELMWGVRDKRTIKDYGGNISQVPDVIDRLLKIFSEFNIGATFATVGFLLARSKGEILKFNPLSKPNYELKKLSPYIGYIDDIGVDKSDFYHYAIDSLIQIQKEKKHEICTHTYSHYYCLEKGQNIKTFEDDISSAVAIAQKEGITFKSIIFPRNQHNSEYNNVLLKNGISIFRGNEKTWFYNPKSGEEETLIRRMMRLIDAYINISGHHTFLPSTEDKLGLINVPSSRFLRPFNPKLSFLEGLRLRRIKKSMTYAAKKGLVYHLWWHPHNFGSYQEENFDFLKKIMNHYRYLNKKYNFTSCTMEDVVINEK